VAENSKIEWTDHTFSPWHGCMKVLTDSEFNGLMDVLYRDMYLRLHHDHFDLLRWEDDGGAREATH
jgi:protein gp37